MKLRSMFEHLPSKAASHMELEEVFSSFETSLEGLPDDEARRRLARFGPNELSTKRTGGWGVFRRQFGSPMIFLLGAASLISLCLREWIDGLTILAMLSINAGIGFFQEYRSERALEKLRLHLSPRSQARRGGALVEIDRSQLVPGDVVPLEPGDIVPAELRIVVSHGLAIDESVLTGESVAVAKSASAEMETAGGSPRAPTMAYLLTQVVAGYGEGIVVASASDSVVGRLAKLVEETPRSSAFERNIRDFSRFLLKAVLLILAVVFAVNLMLKGREQLVPQFLFAVALAVSVVPEALPAITSLTLSKGALQLAKRHVVVKRLSAIEDLGHIEILCTDKTGTITEGIMKVAEVASPSPERCLAWALAAAAEADVRSPSASPKTFDAALAAEAGPEAWRRALSLKRSWFVPFDPLRRRASAVLEEAKGRRLVVLGAPEEILKRSAARLTPAGSVSLTAKGIRAELAAVQAEGLRGRRVLAVAVKTVKAKKAYRDSDERELTYVGRISFTDPLKKTAQASIAEARKLNVRVKILTGDAPEVAGAIGVQVGVLDRPLDVVTGDMLEAASTAEFRALIASRDVFARVTPEQKFKIIEALRIEHQVGFLGEGMNDAPALKAANVALAVDGASDVAREAADIILLKKDLRVIVEGIRQGRAIFTNIVKYVKYTLVGNFGNFLAVAGISLVIADLPMLPIQILLTNLLTDLPLISVSGDAVEEGEVARPKRFNLRELAFVGVFLGLVSSFFDFAFFGLNRGDGLLEVRTLWFLFSVLTELALLYSIRTRGAFWKAARPSAAMIALTLMTAAGALLLTRLPFGREVFQFVEPTSVQIIRIALLAAAYFAVTELVKSAYARLFPLNRASI